jgi:hypothetical protein
MMALITCHNTMTHEMICLKRLQAYTNAPNMCNNVTATLNNR